MTKLSVNINKVALLRNARELNVPNLIQFATDCEEFGAEGITVHPRPDERHIRYADLQPLKQIVNTEFNIEGYPSQRFLDMIEKVRPHQCTLVPDPPDALTSDTGWDTIENQSFLTDVISRLHSWNVRTSLFLDPNLKFLEYAQKTGTDRIELYTGDYARNFIESKEMAVEPFRVAGYKANELGLGINAGHDLNLDNLQYFVREVPHVLEVSIGHALVADALYYGLQNVLGMYKYQIAQAHNPA